VLVTAARLENTSQRLDQKRHPVSALEDILQAFDRYDDRLSKSTDSHGDRPFPWSTMAQADTSACRDPTGLPRRTRGVIRFQWNGNGTRPALRPL
jgi:hypothetical protein